MPRSDDRPGRRKRLRSAVASSTESRTASVDPFALVGLGTALAQCDHEQDIARLAASAVTSALRVPFGAVVLNGEGEPNERTFGQFGGEPLDARLAREIEDLVVTSLGDAHGASAQPISEIQVREDALPAPANAGLRRLLVVRLGTLDTSFGVVVAGRRSAEPSPPEERAILETIAGQASMAIHRAREATERGRAEQALKESEERYRTLYNNTPVMMHSIDRNGRLVSVNDYWLEVLGYERNEVIGRRSTEFLTETSRRYALEVALPEFLETGSARDVEYQMVKENGEVIDVLLSAIAERDEAEEVSRTLAFMIDVTERKRAEEALHRLNKQLQEVSRHKSEFLANLSHELRTPLNVVLGGSELLAEGLFGGLNEKQAEYISDIHESGTHLLSLINDVLDLSKVEAGKLDLHLSQFALRTLMESSAVIVRERAASKSLELNVFLPEEDVLVEADERKVKQIVYNLLSNGVKFTPENGRVAFSAQRNGDEMIFAVEDNGPGVPEELRERIFEEFFQAPGSEDGTGLGLALCRRLVELHGGRIWLESEVGQGSRFLFAIPVAREAAADSDNPSAAQ